jgi:NADH-quinone oxidoreductase subunit D
VEPYYEDFEDEHTLELPSEPMSLNMGPSHPAMHGTIRMVLQLDGETVMHVDIQPGYLHRAFEKSCERGTWNQVFPYVDRLNYVSPMLNNVGFALAAEKLVGLEVPERCLYYRTILGELARISDHLTCNGATAMELGAFTPFLWLIKVRDWIWDVLEQETGPGSRTASAASAGWPSPRRRASSRPCGRSSATSSRCSRRPSTC